MSPEEVRISDVVIRVPPEDGSTWRDAASGNWEPETLSVVGELAEEGRIVIDVGAYVGVVSAVAAGKGARVHAFEPDPVARGSLERMLEENPEIGRSVTVHPEALGAADRLGRLSSERLGNSGSSLARTQADSTDVVVRDAVAALSECGLAECSLLKIDVEGAEYEILPRLLPELKRSRPNLLLAVHTHHFRDSFVDLPRPIRGVLYRLVALPRQAKLVAAVRKLGPTYVSEPNSGRWRRLGGLGLLAAMTRVGGQELLVRPGD